VTEGEGGSGQITSTKYYTYHGYPMKEEMICYYNMSTGYETICKGTDTSGVANSMSNMILDLAGYGSVAVGLFNSAMTACQTYADLTGTAPISGSSEDFVQVKLNYDVSTKYTYADLGYGDGYRLGAVTQKVRLIDIDILQYYADCKGGKELSTHQVLDRTYTTVNYSNPAPKAIASIYELWVERIGAEIYQHPIIF